MKRSSIVFNNDFSLAGTISFIMTFCRLIFAFIAFFLIFLHHWEIIIFLVIMIIIFDQFDGVIFRISSLKNNKIWAYRRRIIDSIIDRLCIHIICIGLIIIEQKFLPIYIAIFIKEFLTSYPCIKAFLNNELLQPSIYSKISTVAVGLLVITFILQKLIILQWLNYIIFILVFVTLFFGVIACIKYSKQKTSSIVFLTRGN